MVRQWQCWTGLGSRAKAVTRRRPHRWQDFAWALLYMSPALALFLTFTYVTKGRIIRRMSWSTRCSRLFGRITATVSLRRLMQEALHKYPQFRVAIEQWRATEPSPATAGAVFGLFTPTRDAIQA